MINCKLCARMYAAVIAYGRRLLFFLTVYFTASSLFAEPSRYRAVTFRLNLSALLLLAVTLLNGNEASRKCGRERLRVSSGR